MNMHRPRHAHIDEYA